MKKTVSIFVCTMILALSVCADEQKDSSAAPNEPKVMKNDMLNIDHYSEDQISLQCMSGYLFSDTGIGPKIDDMNQVQNNIRICWMLNTPSNTDSPFRGNWEAIGELSGTAMVGPYGSLMVGPTFLVRYNFVQPGWKIVPYIQGGAGIVYTDIYEHEQQRAVGQAAEFTPQIAVGARCLLSRDWSLDIEAKYNHVSNAGMSDRNLGINALGGSIGFTYFFEKPWK